MPRYDYLAPSSTWFFNARAKAMEIIKKNSPILRGDNRFDSKAWVQSAAQLLPLAIFTSLPNYLQFCRFPTHFTLLRHAVASCKLHNDSSHCGLLLHLVGFLSWCDILLLRAPLCANKCDFPSLSPTLYHRQSHHQAYLIL